MSKDDAHSSQVWCSVGDSHALADGDSSWRAGEEEDAGLCNNSLCESKDSDREDLEGMHNVWLLLMLLTRACRALCGNKSD